MSTQTVVASATPRERASSREDAQYSLWQIIAIWAGAALPAGLGYWILMPLLLSRGVINPFMYLFVINAGLVWQFILAFLILRREVKPFTWQGIKDRLWLQTPSNPKTGTASKWLYLWTIPAIALSTVGFMKLGWLNDLWVSAFPFLALRPYADPRNLADVAVGQWWLLGLLALQFLFNYLLGEELIFRGILLPKMSGTFGKWDWLANHLLFVAYHLHMLHNTPSRLLLDVLYPFPARRFRSYWMAAIIHGFDAVSFTVLFIMAIQGQFAS